MPNGNGDTAFGTYNNPTQRMNDRAGVGMSDKDALNELAERRKSTATPSPSASLTPQASSGDDADKAALSQLQQRRESSLASSSEEKATPAERVAGGFEEVVKQPNPVSELYTRTQAGEGIGSAAWNTLSNLEQQHPWAAPVAGSLAALAAPELGIGKAAFAGVRYGVPFLMRNLQRLGLAGMGLEQIYEHGPSLLKLIRPSAE